MTNYEQADLFDDNPEYQAFVDKFKPKKTTDDCYTPPYIYDAVKEWAVAEYGLQERHIIRPFYPGGDYENAEYPDNCVVIDNPPFSILSKILDFYEINKIDYFLFAPALTVLSTCGNRNANAIISDSAIIYENGANVKTAFVTNMGRYKIHVSCELHEAIEQAQEKAKKEKTKTLPKYVYPGSVLTSAIIQKIASNGQTLRILPDECCFTRALDAQKNRGKALFGGGFLLSERAAAERAAAERAAAERWELSEREKNIIARLSYADR